MDFERAKDLFTEALRIDLPEDRSAYLDRSCAAEPKVRAMVESFLEAQGRMDGFLEVPEIEPPEPSPLEGPGTRIGRYRLLDRIGEGGFGVVYQAEQEEPVQRQVALKIIKLGMDTRQVIARFEAERQALAMMDHPSIAKVLDAGATETGRPYFVMELVRGVPITKFCEENRLSIRARLELFVTVCHAIQHAHQKGIIHRDVKPSNVLVTQNEGLSHPVVIDFGVAKAIDRRLTEKAFHTQFAQLIGTPAYMSPEQAEMSPAGTGDVDTRTDVYSLGFCPGYLHIRALRLRS
jgi:serine/threonine protein kinase